MAWQEIEIDAPRALVDKAGRVLADLGTTGLQEEHRPGEAPPPRQPWDTGRPPEDTARVLLRAWFEHADRAQIDAALRDGLGKDASKCTWRWSDVPEVDWTEAWKKGFAPMRVSPRIVIAPPWDAPAEAVIIEPGQGFGTGAHPTTRQALRALDDLADGVQTVLDVGTGSGILAIAAARLGLAAVGIDVDPAAIEDARRNAERNGVSVAFSTRPLVRAEPADLVLANLHAELVTSLAGDLVRVTGRWLVVAGILGDREPAVLAAMSPPLRLTGRDADGEWVCLRFRRGA